MVAQGDWKTLHQFALEQKEAMDLTPERLIYIPRPRNRLLSKLNF
jgi:hypothetical protein